jgi:serine/threonine protein kinase
VRANKVEFTIYFVEFFGWYENEENIFLAMEYFEHGTLDHYISAEMTEEDAKVISLQLLEGLSVMHEQGFVHRDLKPQVSSHQALDPDSSVDC